MQNPERARVLVIDDEPMVGAVLRRLLSRDADVAVVASAIDGLARLGAGERFDLVLCDVRLPGVLGPDFVRCVRRFVPDAADAVVLMSGAPLAADAPAPFLAKPFDNEAVHALVRARLARRTDPAPPAETPSPVSTEQPSPTRS